MFCGLFGFMVKESVSAEQVDFNEWDALIRVIFSRRRKTLRRQFRKLSASKTLPAVLDSCTSWNNYYYYSLRRLLGHSYSHSLIYTKNLFYLSVKGPIVCV